MFGTLRVIKSVLIQNNKIFKNKMNTLEILDMMSGYLLVLFS